MREKKVLVDEVLFCPLSMYLYVTECRGLGKCRTQNPFICWFINPLPNNSILDYAKIKVCAEDDWLVALMMEFVFDGLENSGKRKKNAAFPTIFSKAFFSIKGSIKAGFCVKLLTDDKILDWSKLKQIAENILKCI